MIAELAGGKILKGVVEAEGRPPFAKATEGLTGSRQARGRLKIEYEKINSYAGLNLEKEKINEILENLGFKIEGNVAEIPTWRHDIAIWQDLAEEIYRINGLEKISPEPLPEMQKAKPSDYYPTSPRQNGATRDEMGINYDTVFRKKEKIKDYLVELGLDEAISYTFLSDTDVVAAKLSSSDLLEVANPVQDENRYLRNSLIPGLLKAIAKNPSFDDIEFFEMGNVFTKTDEWTSLALATTGKSARKASEIVAELTKLGFDTKSIKTYEIDREELKRFKIKKPSVSVAEVRISDLLENGKFDYLKLIILDKKIEYRPISKFPPVKRDLAFVVDTKTNALEIQNLIFEITPKAILVELFDEFVDKRFGENKKSVAFHIWLEDQDKTLSDDEADEEISKIISTLSEKFGAKLRSK